MALGPLAEPPHVVGPDVRVVAKRILEVGRTGQTMISFRRNIAD